MNKKALLGTTLIILIGVIVLFIAGVVIYFVFSGGKEGAKQDNTSNGKQSIVDCGETPADFTTEMGNDDVGYFQKHLEVKQSLECSSNNLKDCKPSKIKYNGPVDNIFSVKGVENGKCILDYKSGDKGVECEYTIEQIKMLYEVAEEHGKPWGTAFAISFGMGFEILNYSPEKTFEQEITNKYTGQKEKVPCKFYGI